MCSHIRPLVVFILCVLTPLTVSGQHCSETLHDLEDSLFCSPTAGRSNVDSLVSAFFPTNSLPASAVEVYYHISDSTGNDGLITADAASSYAEAGTSGNQTVHRYRWSWSPLLLFMEPFQATLLSLYLVVIHTTEVHVVLGPVCSSNISDNGVASDLIIINQLTAMMKSSLGSPYICNLEQRTSVVESNLGYVSFFDPATESYISLTSRPNRKLYIDFLTVSILSLAMFIGLLTPYLIYTFYSKYYMEERDINTKFLLEDIFWSTSFIGLILVIVIIGIDINHFRLGLLSRKDPNEAYLYMVTLVFYVVTFLGDILSASMVFYHLVVTLHQHGPRHVVVFSSLPLWIAFLVINAVAHLLTFHCVFIIMAFLVSPLEVLLNLIFYCSCVLCAISLFILFFQIKRSGSTCMKWFKFIAMLFFSLFLVFILLAINQLILHLSRNTAFSDGYLPQLITMLVPALLLNSLAFTLLHWYISIFRERQNTEALELELAAV